MARPPEVVLIRHGETTWSRSGQHTGRTDLPLTERGRRQAEALGAAMAAIPVARILTSPLQRATETCRLAGLTGTEVDDLVEWDYGVYEGRTTAEIREEVPGWTVWDGPVPEGERLDEVAARADRVIARIEAAGEDVAVVSHGHFLRVLAARWLELPPIEGRRLLLDTATLCLLGSERGVRAVRRWNAPPPGAGAGE
ncbi:MAG: Phosphoglycerate mutase [Acidimicrobiales bacterium]|nr:Phosphoglycerate mutase [Acidimicrobiales bacterium]